MRSIETRPGEPGRDWSRSHATGCSWHQRSANTRRTCSAPAPARRGQTTVGSSTGARPSAPCRRPPTCWAWRSLTNEPTASSGSGSRRSLARRRASRSSTTGTRSACAPLAPTASRSIGVRVDANRLQDAFPFGRADGAWLERYLTSGLAHASATLGIAEAAHATVTRSGPGPSLAPSKGSASGHGRCRQRGRTRRRCGQRCRPQPTASTSTASASNAARR
jgi:hypothetical protein